MNSTRLELSLLGLEDTVELGSEHDVALDLELARHECLLAVELAVSHVDKGVIAGVDGHIGLGALLDGALVCLGVLIEGRKRKEAQESE